MKINNNLSDKNLIDPIDSSQLSYKDDVRKDNLIRKAADNSPTKNLQHIQNKIPALKNIPKLRCKSTSLNSTNISPLQDTINIQLLYNPNQGTKLRSCYTK